MTTLMDAERKARRGFALVLGFTTLGVLAYGFLVPPVGAADSKRRVNAMQTSPVTVGRDRTALGVPSPVVFPLVTSADRRYLQDQNGQPFPILGRTAWFITSLSVTDYQFFIDDTVNKGFNAIEFHVINHQALGNNPPFAGNGALPFTKQLNGLPWAGSLTYGNINSEAPDFTQTNEVFWTQVDSLLTYAESKGVLCFMFPAYVGYQGGAEGWMAEMTANGTTKMTTYGAFIANRYKNYPNIVWLLGGDYGTPPATFNAPQLAVEQALLSGLKSVSGQQSTNFSAEWAGDSIYTTQTDATLKAAGTLQGAYTWGSVPTWCRNGYAASPTMPAFLVEGRYSEEGPNGYDESVNVPGRRLQWWAWLSGIGGYINGNGYVWLFNATGFASPWTSHLNTPTTLDNARLNAFIKSVAWQTLVPSGLGGMKTLVTSGGSTVAASDYVAAAANPGGTLLVAYVPPAHTGTITVDMTAMGGPAEARWFNPTTAAYTLISSSIANTGTHTFTPPADNGSGYDDWVLVLDLPTANPTPTPTRTPAPTLTPTPHLKPVSNFIGLTPCRLVDTRRPVGRLGGPALDAATPRTFAVANVCNLPSTARAIVVNITVIEPSTAGDYRLYAADIPPPIATNLSFRANQVSANNAVLALSGDGLGRFTVQPDLTSGTAHLVVDVSGYFQ